MESINAYCTPTTMKSSDQRYTKTDKVIFYIFFSVLIPLSAWAHWSQDAFMLLIALSISFLCIIILSIRFYSPGLNAVIGSLLPFIIISPALFISDWFRAIELFFLAVPLQCLAGITIASIVLFLKKGREGFHKNIIICIACFSLCSLFLLSLGGNWTAGVLTFMSIGFLPVFILFEIYHWASRKQFILVPYRIGISSGAIVGMAAIFFMVATSHGESGLATVAVSPFIFLAFVCAGILVAWFYKWRGRPFCSSIIKKDQRN